MLYDRYTVEFSSIPTAVLYAADRFAAMSLSTVELNERLRLMRNLNEEVHNSYAFLSSYSYYNTYICRQWA